MCLPALAALMTKSEWVSVEEQIHAHQGINDRNLQPARKAAEGVRGLGGPDTPARQHQRIARAAQSAQHIADKRRHTLGGAPIR